MAEGCRPASGYMMAPKSTGKMAVTGSSAASFDRKYGPNRPQASSQLSHSSRGALNVTQAATT